MDKRIDFGLTPSQPVTGSWRVECGLGGNAPPRRGRGTTETPPEKTTESQGEPQRARESHENWLTRYTKQFCLRWFSFPFFSFLLFCFHFVAASWCGTWSVECGAWKVEACHSYSILPVIQPSSQPEYLQSKICHRNPTPASIKSLTRLAIKLKSKLKSKSKQKQS